ncbi:VP13C protein, partial [Polypterus senegalus]
MRATIKKDIREAKRQLERNIADKAKEDPKTFYQYFSSKRTVKEEVKFIRNSKGELKDTDNEIADALNLHFSEVVLSEQVDNLPEVNATTKETFVDNFQSAKEALSAATATAAEIAASSVIDFAKKSYRLSMDVKLKAPVIIIPQSSVSLNAIVADLGLITVKNHFHLITATECPVPPVLDKMEIKLTKLKLSRTVLDDKSHLPSVEILQPVNLDLVVNRNLSSAWYNKIPGIELKGELKSVNVVLRQDDFGLLMNILVENIGEGSKNVQEENQAKEAFEENQVLQSQKAVAAVANETRNVLTNEIASSTEDLANITLSFVIQEVVLQFMKVLEERESPFLMLHILQLGTEFTTARHTMKAAAYLKKVNMVNYDFTDSKGQPLQIISSSDMHGEDLLQVEYIKADKNGPNFKTQHQNTEQTISIVSIVGDEVFSFKMVLYPFSAEEDDYIDAENGNGSLTLRVGCIQIVYLHKFLVCFWKFIDNFQDAKKALSAATAQAAEKAASSVKDFAQNSFHMAMDINIKAPVILIPQSSISHNAVEVDLGRLTLQNQFYFIPEENCPLPPKIDKMNIELAQLKLSRLLMRENSTHPNIELLEPVNMILSVKRNLSASWYHAIPSMEISVDLKPLKVIISQDDLALLLKIFLENISEGTSQQETKETVLTSSQAQRAQKVLAMPKDLIEIENAESAEQLIKETETLKFSFNFESLSIVLLNSHPTELQIGQRHDSLLLAEFGLCLMTMSGKMLESGYLELSAKLMSCTLDDMRLGIQKVTSRMIDKKKDIGTNAMIDMKYFKSKKESSLLAVLQKPYVCASIEFLQTVADFFIKAIPQSPLTVPDKSNQLQMKQVPSAKGTSGTAMSGSSIKVKALITDPEIVFVANLMKADAPALSVSFTCDFEMVSGEGSQTVKTTLKDLQVLACPFIRNESDKAITTILKPCCLTLETKFFSSKPLSAAVTVEEVIIKISPVIINTLMTIMAAMSTQPKSEDTQENISDVSTLWAKRNVQKCNYWYLGVDTAREVTEQLTDLEASSSGENFSVDIKVIQVTLESGLGHRTAPLLLAESSFNGAAKNWTSQLHVSTDMTLEVHYYNESRAVWEPFIERIDSGKKRWNLKLEMKNNPVQDKSPVPGDDFVLLPEPKTSINICSKDTLNVTVSKCTLAVFTNLAKAFSEGTTSSFNSLLKEKAAYTIKNALGIPLIVRHSTNLKPINSDENVQNIPEGQSLELDFSNSEPSRRGRLSALQRQESNLFTIIIFPHGYSEIADIPIIKPSRRLYNVRCSDMGRSVSVLTQIDAVDGCKMITVRSPLQIKNHFSITFAIFKFSVKTKSMDFVGEAEPEKEFHVPLDSYRCHLFLKPAGSLKEHFQISTSYITWKEELRRSTVIRGVLDCPSSEVSFLPLRVNTYACPDQLNFISCQENDDWDPAYIIHLHPTLKIRNLLPYSICYLLEGSAETYELAEGCSADVLNAQVGGEIMELVLLKYQGRNWHGHVKIQQGLPEFFLVCFTCDSMEKLTVDLSIHVEETQECLILSVFSPYWIINKTSRVLQYRAEDIHVKHPSDFRDVILFSFKKKNIFSQNKVQLRVSTSSWSSSFSMDTVGSYGCVKCPADNMEYLVGVGIQMSSFNLTRIVTLSPFYTLVNKSSYELEVGELQMTTSITEKWHYIAASECLPFWPETSTGRLCVRVVGSETSSKSFEYNKQDNGTLLRMDMCGGIIVDVNITDHANMITLSDYYDGAAPALIINHTSMLTLKYKQSGVVEEEELQPGEVQFFAWTNPAATRKLSWHCPVQSGELDLIKTTQIHWVTFLDGRQRVLLFTEDVAIVSKARQAEELEQFEKEICISLQNLGLSLVNNENKQEISYVGVTSSGVVWEMKSKNRWKPFNQKNIHLLEQAYQKHVSEKNSSESNWIKLGNNFEVDNQMCGAIFPIVFHPVPPPKSIALDSEPKPFIDVSIIIRFNEHSQVMQFKYFMALIQEMALKVDQGFLGAISELLSSTVDPLATKQKTKLIEQDLESLKAELIETSVKDSSRLNFFEHFHISPVKLHLSLSLGSGGQDSEKQDMVVVRSINLLLKSIGATLTDVDDLIFKLAFFQVKYQFYRNDQLMWTVIRHYTEQFLKQMYVLVLGLDVLGNPFGLIRGLTEGVEAFFYEPFQGVVGGVTGIITKPVEGAKKEGAAGFFKGIGKGLVGVVARPTGGIIDMASSTFQGIQRVAESTEEVYRIRPPRVIHEDGIIRPYDQDEAEGCDLFEKSEIKKLEDEIFHSHYGLPGSKNTNIIVTNRRVMCIKEIEFVGHFTKDWECMFENFTRPSTVDGNTLKLYSKNGRLTSDLRTSQHHCHRRLGARPMPGRTGRQSVRAPGHEGATALDKQGTTGMEQGGTNLWGPMASARRSPKSPKAQELCTSATPGKVGEDLSRYTQSASGWSRSTSATPGSAGGRTSSSTWSTSGLIPDIGRNIVSYVLNDWDRFKVWTDDDAGDNYTTQEHYKTEMLKPFTYGSACHPEPELTWYKDDVEMDRYCGLPKYEIFRNGKVHTLHIYNCTEDDAAIYQASARNSKGIVSCSGVLEVATMTEYKIHQRWFAKLKQKAAVKMKELEESRKRGKENVIEAHEQLRTTSPERVQRKRRSPGDANILSSASLQSRNDVVKINIPDTESRLQEDASDVKESASDVPNGFLAGSKESHDDSISQEVMLENGNGNSNFLTYIYETVEIVTKKPASKEFLAKKKKKISNQVDGGQGTEEREKRSNEEHAKGNESMSLAQYLAESLMSQIPEEKEKTVESSDLMDETPVLITQSSRISEQSNNMQTMLHKETEFHKSPPDTSPGYFSLRDIFFGNKEDSFLSELESEENKASGVKEMPPQITSTPTAFEKINSSKTVNAEIKSQIEERSMMETENTTAIDNIHTGTADSIPRSKDNKLSANEQTLTLDSFQSSANEVLVYHKPEEKSLLSFMEREEEEEDSVSKQNVLQQEQFKQADISEVGYVENHEDLKKSGSPEDDKKTLLVLKSDRLAVEPSEETFQLLDVSNDVTFQEESEQKSSEQTNKILKLLIEPQHTSHEFPVEFRGNSNTRPVILDEYFNHTDRVEYEISTNIEKTENQTNTEHLGIVKESYVDIQNDTLSSAEDNVMITPNKVHTVIPVQHETKLISDIIEPPMKLFDIPVSCPETIHIFQLNTGNMQDECRNVSELSILQTEENAISQGNEAEKITQSFPEKTIVEKENIGILDHQTVVKSDPDQNCYSATLNNVEPLIPQEELPDMMTKDHEVSEGDNTFKQQKPFTDNILPLQQGAVKVPLISKTVSSENIAQSSNILTAVDKNLSLDVSPAVGNKPHENIYSVVEMPSVETEDLFINHNESLVEVLRSVKKDLENSQNVETLPLDTNKDGVAIMSSNNENSLDNNFFSPSTEAVAETSKKVILLSEADKLAVSTDMYVIFDGKPNIPDDNLSIKGLKNEETISITQSTQSIHISKLKESTQAPSEYNILEKKEKDPKCAPAVLIESSTSANTAIADVLGLSSVPSIRVDDTLFKEVYNQQEASPQTEIKDKPLTQHSSENSPKLKHNEILPLIPSATPEELASGARRKIFISKSKGDELDGTILDNQVKKEEISKRRQLSQDLESPCASPGQSRRGLTFLQPPMAPHTTSVEKCSPKLNRKVSTLEVPKLYEDANVKNESNKDFKTDIKAEEMKKQQDPFKDESLCDEMLQNNVNSLLDLTHSLEGAQTTSKQQGYPGLTPISIQPAQTFKVTIATTRRSQSVNTIVWTKHSCFRCDQLGHLA